MKVLHIATAFATDESSIITPWLTKLIISQRELGIDARVFASSYKGLGDNRIFDIPVYRFRYSPKSIENLTYETPIYEVVRRNPVRYLQIPLFFLGGILKGRRLQWQPDILHIHWPIPLVIFTSCFRNVPYVLHYHQSELSLARKFTFIKKFLAPQIANAQANLCNSHFTLEKFKQMFPGIKAQVVPMPISIDLPTQFVSEKEKEKTVLFVGKMIKWKGGHILIKSAKILKDEGIDIKLRMVGDGADRSEWENLAHSLGVDAEFTGYLFGKKLAEQYKKSFIFVLPSIGDPKVCMESLGIVLLEAMIYGNPVIASNLGGPAEIVTQSQAGLLFESGNPEDLADKLKILLTNDHLRKEMARRGYEFAQKFTPDAVARQTLKIYKKILAEHQ
ncbi:glycosyltransferase family 4 protein [bacterium]|nr:glycosyltransferase family 4 protein [bacterium]